MTTRYVPRHDAWLVALVSGAAVVTATATAALFLSPQSLWVKAFFTVVCLAPVLFIATALANTYYLLSPDILFIRFGLLRWTVPLDTIREVVKERNLGSSAAWSVNRLRVSYGPAFMEVYISPADESGFLDDLATRVPDLERRGGSLFRSSRITP